MNEDDKLTALARQALYAAARDDLGLFTSLIFGAIEPETVFKAAPHFQVLSRALQDVLDGKTPRLLLAVPPRFGKSMLGSVALPAFALGRQPGLKVICASYGDQLAKDFALKTRNVMTSEAYAAIFPGAALEGASALEELKTPKKGYRLATSVGGVVTGKGANLIIIDDPLKAIEAESEPARRTAYDWVKGSLMSRFDLGELGRMIVIMQRLHQDDLIGRLKAEEGWKVLEMPARAIEPLSFDLGGGKTWSLKGGDLLYPEGLGEAALAERRASMSEAAFNAQYLQRPDAAGGTLFKLKHFQRYEQRPYDHHIELIVQSWDLALSEEDNPEGCFSVCTTWAICGLKLYLLHVFRRKLEFPQLIKAMESLRDRHRAHYVIVETSGLGKGVFQQANKVQSLQGKLVP